MKVLLTPTNVSSQTSVMTRALRAIGVNARGLVRDQFKHFDPSGLEIRSPYQSSSKYFSQRRFQDIKWLLYLIPAMHWADVVHWRWARPSTYGALDLRFLQFIDRCRFVDFCGSDIRLPSVAAKDNEYFRKAWKSNFLRYNNDDIPKSNQSCFATLGFHSIVRHRELFAYIEPAAFSSVTHINAPVMTSEIKPVYPDPDCRRPVIYHCPSRHGDKGSAAVRATIEHLKTSSHFEYVELQGVPRHQLLEKISEADIVLDQFVYGDFGNFALEAMAAGKPVVCYLKPQVLQMVPEIPIVNASQESLTDVLSMLIKHPQGRRELGYKSRLYVEKYHDAIKIAKELYTLYQDKLYIWNRARRQFRRRVRTCFMTSVPVTRQNGSS